MSGLSPITKAVVGAFVVSGTIHVVRPQTFDALMPEWLPAHKEIVVGSGVAELVCAAAVVNPRTRRMGALASAALLIGVYPGNVQMALGAQKTHNTGYKIATLARLPLQWPMISAMLKTAREAKA
ncbi:membrane protein [Nocardioides baekrokdamisoli]|uniref:Membrane protein n=1 Tax=Nocardioides baekrokdamisoli TaxID=1804624 RepID=A0A3G9J0T4_9ACTN|nr:DoxX family protein [Nocardioides baekrokdamisoli]BBH18243.1 membrane protein [Nocardioides baekrokdamisoli]